MLRKAGMIGSIFFLALADSVMQFNLINAVPENILEYLPIKKIALCEFFGLMFILYESTSCLKNMSLIDMPVSKRFNKKIQEWLKSVTSELDNKKK